MSSKTLLQKNTRFLLLWLPLIMLFCSLLFYLMLRMQARHMQEKQLLVKQHNLWNTFSARQGNMERSITGEYAIRESNMPILVKQQPIDTLIYFPDRQQYLPFEMLTIRMEWNHRFYQVTTYVSSTEISHLIIKVFISEAVILVLLLLTIVVLNRKSSGLLWRPFFSTIKEMEAFDITRNQVIELPAETGTTEFDTLNRSITSLVNHVHAAYFHQKQFVENASHEMQTPLAIIRSKLELLINQPRLTSGMAGMLQDITEANDRLSQMNRTLLLLAKIENNQFPETKPVNLSQLLQQLLSNLRDYYASFPSLTSHISEEVMLTANPSLVEILVTNLVNNAVLHNTENGEIRVTLQPDRLLIENTGPAPTEAPALLFERFKKGSYQSKTTGLGLSLVKQICLLYRYTITYEYTDGWHRVQVIFG